MIRFYDSLQQPSPVQLQFAVNSGIHGWAGYLGGPERVDGVWDKATFDNIASFKLSTAGFIVGLDDPNISVQRSGERLPLGSVVGHDIETNFSVSRFTDAYAESWASTMRSAGFAPVLYGLPSLCKRFGSHYDGVWFAGGSYYRTGKNPAPSDPRESGYAIANSHQAWQWYGTHNFNGIGVDESVCDDFFAGVPMGQMTLDVAQSVVFSTRLLALGSPGTQADVDFTAMDMVSGNPEAALTRLQELLQADPNFVWNRIKAVEKQLADAVKGGVVLDASVAANLQDQITAIKSGLHTASL